MARLPRLSIAGWPHLLIHRGHNASAVVLDDADRQQLLALLRDAASAQRIVVHAYALIDNELRLLATPPSAEALSKFMQAIGRRYGIYFNRRHARAGSLWEGRFRSTVIDPDHHLLECMRFVEQGADPEWSSISHHRGLRPDGLVADHLVFWRLGNTPFDREIAYKKEEEQALTKLQIDRIEAAVWKGLPLGPAKFVEQLGQTTTRRLVALKRGRPPRESVPN